MPRKEDDDGHAEILTHKETARLFMPFDVKHEAALDALLSQLAPRISSLSTADHQSLKSHVDGIAECIAIAIVFLEGFADIAAQGPLHARVPTEVQRWVAAVPRNQSGGRLAGMSAASICSVLEDFIVDAGARKLTPAHLAWIRAADPKIPADDNVANSHLMSRIKPSAKANGVQWIAALGLVFAFALTQEESDTLVDLIVFRNGYIHDSRTAFAQVITGEHIKCWTAAAMILCHRIALA